MQKTVEAYSVFEGEKMGKIILIIEDDKGLNQGVALALRKPDWKFLQAFSLKEGPEYWESAEVDMVLLDINLPDGSGYDFLGHVRTASSVPVIMLTANDMEIDEVRGIEMGADDYITKPFSLMVLRARVERLFARLENDTGSSYQKDGYFFAFDRQVFEVLGNPIELSRTEQKLLRMFISHPGQTLTREILNEGIWQEGSDYIDENALSVAVGRLRKKLKLKEKESPIRTVYGIGYVWEKGE